MTVTFKAFFGVSKSYSTRSSCMSLVISATWVAREAYFESPARSSSYPFIAAPQPAEAETIASGLLDKNESIFFLAILMADSTSPE